MNKPTSTHHRRFPPSKDSSPVLRFPPCEYASPRSAGRYSSRRLQWKLGEQRIPECSHGGICTVYINQYQHLYIIYHPKRNVHIIYIYIYIIQIKNEISSPYSIYIYIYIPHIFHQKTCHFCHPIGSPSGFLGAWELALAALLLCPGGRL